jgi:hypothetical protein
MIFSINKFIIHVYYFLLANQLTNTKKDWDSLSRKRNNIRKFPDISRGLSKYVNRAIYPERMLEILPKKHYTDFPLLPNELDA